MEIQLSSITKTGLLSYIINVVGLNATRIQKYTIVKNKSISVSYKLKSGKVGCTFIGLEAFKVAELKRMVVRVNEVTPEKLLEYGTNYTTGFCKCESMNYNLYKVNGVPICKHLVYQVKNDAIAHREIGNLQQLSDYIKNAQNK